MPGQYPSIRFKDLPLHQIKLHGQRHQTFPRRVWQTIILTLCNARQQNLHTIATDAGDNAKFSHVGADRVDQRCALADK